jgi:hypothetical protein
VGEEEWRELVVGLIAEWLERNDNNKNGERK